MECRCNSCLYEIFLGKFFTVCDVSLSAGWFLAIAASSRSFAWDDDMDIVLCLKMVLPLEDGALVCSAGAWVWFLNVMLAFWFG